MPLETLQALAGDPDAHYRPFEKRRPGKKPRLIDRPNDGLKEVQRRIRAFLVEELSLPLWMHGCVTGRSPLTNAAVHVQQPNVARVDVKSFFPRVTYRMVYEIFRRCGLGPEPARLLTQLTTRGGHLPQGAPTSDRLANLHLSTVNDLFESILRELDLNGSAYVDDITVSGERTTEAIPRLIAMLRTVGLSVSRKNRENVGSQRAHRVTGYNTNGKSPTLGRETRSKIRAIVHHFILERRSGRRSVRLEHAIRTRLGQLRLTNRGDAERLHRQLIRSGIDLRPKRRRRIAKESEAPKVKSERAVSADRRAS